MKKIFAISVFFIASLFILIGNLKPVSAQENLPKLAKVSKMNENIKKYFEKSKQFSKEKWENFQTIRDDYFAEPIEAKGITFIDKNGNQIKKAYFSISSKLRINPVIKITNTEGSEIKAKSWQVQGRNSRFMFIEVIGYSRTKTDYNSDKNQLLPTNHYYVLALRIPEGEKNSEEIWPVPVSKTEFKRLKSLKTSAIGERVTPIDGYNY